MTRRGHIDDGCDLFVMLSGRVACESRVSPEGRVPFSCETRGLCVQERSGHARGGVDATLVASHAARSVRSGPVPHVCVLCVLRCLL